MAISRLSVFAVLFLTLADICKAWGPIFEPLKGGWNIGTALRALRNGAEDEEHPRGERLPRHQHDSFMFYFQSRGDMNPILKPIIAWEESFPFLDSTESLFVEDECVGDDCEEECSIPDEYKTPEAEQIDVMAYLGITRAEPIRVREGVNSVWE